jgi:poly(A) polymerase
MHEDFLPVDLIDKIKQIGRNGESCYLVGGAIRDALLQKPVRDLDFILSAGSLAFARRIADDLQADFYILDSQRSTGRVLFTQANGEQITLDFALLRADSLENDLRARDFTFNAIAVDLQDLKTLIDPLHGGADLQKQILRACSPANFQDDPVRLMRAVRFSINLDLHMEPATLVALKKAAPLLSSVSPERIRDELFRILESPHPAAGLRLLDKLQLLPQILPELQQLIDLTQRPPHVHDVFEHTLAAMRHLEILLDVLTGERTLDRGANLIQGQALTELGQFGTRIKEHLTITPIPNRTKKGLLFFATAYHDIGKPAVITQDQTSGVHFYDHEKAGSDLAAARVEALMLGGVEIHRVRCIVRQHMRVHNLARRGELLTRRNIYRFFRDCGDMGVEVCLFSLADLLATFENEIPQSAWLAELRVCWTLLEAWWEQKADLISPIRLLAGDDLMTELGLSSGPQIGSLLECIIEAQAAGEIGTKSEALTYARKLVSEQTTREKKEGKDAD